MTAALDTPNAACDTTTDAFIEPLIARMTLAQKVGQMTQPDIRWITPDEVRQYAIGSVLNGGGAWPQQHKHATLADWLALARAFDAAALAADNPLPIPLVWGTDAVHGHNNLVGATIFPHNIGLGAAGDEALVREIARATARAVRASGIGWAFAPAVCVAQDARWGRTYEAFSDDPALVARLGRAAVEGLQGALGSDDSVIACAKHFAGDGGTEGGRDQGVARCTRAAFEQVHLAGYRSAIAAGVQSVMASFSSWQETDAAGHLLHDHGKLHGSHHLLTEVLRGQLGFDGLVVSDWNGVGQVPGCSNHRCAAALNAGIDIVMVPEQWREFIADTIDLVERGEVPMARIDDAVRRILRLKWRAGLFRQPSSQGRWAGDAAALRDRPLARRAVRQSLVLLKHERPVLPLPRGARVLVLGSAADDLMPQTGGWTLTWQGSDNQRADFPQADTVLDGLRAALGVDQVAYQADGTHADPTGFDAAIAVLGEPPYAEGAGDLPPPASLHHAARQPADLALLDRVAGRGVPVVTVLLSGRPLYVNDLLNRSDAFIAAWLPGTEGGGIADLLVRGADGAPVADFTGRLPCAWPAAPSPEQPAAPLFPRGFGLRLADRRPLGRLPEAAAAAVPAGPTVLSLFDRVPARGVALALGATDGQGQERVLGDDLNATVHWPADRPAISVSTVQVHTQQDGRRVHWTGPARLALRCNPALRVKALRDAALLVDLVPHQLPARPLTLDLVSEGPCHAGLDIAPWLRRQPAGRVATLRVPLARFSAAGPTLDLDRLQVPFSLACDGPARLDIARVRIAEGEATGGDTLDGAGA